MKELTYNQLIEEDCAAYPAQTLINLKHCLMTDHFRNTTVAELLATPVIKGSVGYYSVMDYGLGGNNYFTLFANSLVMFNQITTNGMSESDISQAMASDIEGLICDYGCHNIEISGFSIDDTYQDTRRPIGFNSWNSPLIDVSEWDKLTGNFPDVMNYVINSYGFDGRERSKLRRIVKSMTQDLTWHISPGSDNEFQDWECEMLHRRRSGTHWPHALGQLLWSYADPTAFVLTFNFKDGTLAARCWFTIRNNVIIYNGMQVNQDRAFNNIGMAMFMALIYELVTTNQSNLPKVIEPTCETNPFYKDPTDVYKRLWSKKFNTRYGILGLYPADTNKYSPPYYKDGKWEDTGDHFINGFDSEPSDVGEG